MHSLKRRQPGALSIPVGSAGFKSGNHLLLTSDAALTIATAFSGWHSRVSPEFSKDGRYLLMLRQHQHCQVLHGRGDARPACSTHGRPQPLDRVHAGNHLAGTDPLAQTGAQPQEPRGLTGHVAVAARHLEQRRGRGLRLAAEDARMRAAAAPPFSISSRSTSAAPHRAARPAAARARGGHCLQPIPSGLRHFRRSFRGQEGGYGSLPYDDADKTLAMMQ
jgi:hypothetical protein